MMKGSSECWKVAVNAEGYRSCMYTLYIWETHESDCMKEEQQEIHMASNLDGYVFEQ